MADQLLLSIAMQSMIAITAIGLLCAWLVYEYVTFKQAVCNTLRVTAIHCEQLLLRVMADIDKLITDLVKEEESVANAVASQQQTMTVTTATDSRADLESKREKLAAAVACGQFNLKYKGGLLTEERLSKLSDQEVHSLYVTYETRLGSAMMKSLGQTAIRLYAHTLRQAFPEVLPEEEVKPLISDLETDPFLRQLLGDTCCQLYHTFGKLLAPLSVGLTTANHCKFGNKAAPPQEEVMLRALLSIAEHC